MVARKHLIAKAFALALVTYPQLVSAADMFTSESVLTWEERDQNALFQSSITMIGIVATQVRPDIARCINDWYSASMIARRQEHIRDVMRQYPDHHPQAIILAVIEKACGQFEDR